MANRRRSEKAPRDKAQDRKSDPVGKSDTVGKTDTVSKGDVIGDPPTPKQPEQKDPTPSEQPVQEVASRDDIARRAYDLFQQRGRNDGRDLDDWLQAERDLKA